MTEPAAWMNLATAYELLSLGLLLPGRETAEALARGELAEVAEEVFAIPSRNSTGMPATTPRRSSMPSAWNIPGSSWESVNLSSPPMPE